MSTCTRISGQRTKRPSSTDPLENTVPHCNTLQHTRHTAPRWLSRPLLHNSHTRCHFHLHALSHSLVLPPSRHRLAHSHTPCWTHLHTHTITHTHTLSLSLSLPSFLSLSVSRSLSLSFPERPAVRVRTKPRLLWTRRRRRGSCRGSSEHW